MPLHVMILYIMLHYGYSIKNKGFVVGAVAFKEGKQLVQSVSLWTLLRTI